MSFPLIAKSLSRLPLALACAGLAACGGGVLPIDAGTDAAAHDAGPAADASDASVVDDGGRDAAVPDSGPDGGLRPLARFDVNGDGFADAIVGADDAVSSAGRAYMYLGSLAGLSDTPAVTLVAPDDGKFGHSVASAGDVNGDGFADAIVGAPGAVSSAGRAYLYLGGAGGLSATPAATLVAPDGGEFGSSVASAGDVNGDGFVDVIVGAHLAVSRTGRAYLYLGSAGGLSATPAVTLLAPDAGLFGGSVASAGDVNGDGFADVIVGAEVALSSTGRAYLFLGSSGGLSATAAVTLVAPDGGYFGFSVASAGDVNGDGFADAIVGAWVAASNEGRAYVYLGSAAGLAATPAVTLVPPDGAEFGHAVASAGDVNGDGFADVIVAGTGPVSSAGRAYVYLGSAAATSATSAVSLAAPDGGDFGVSIAIAGDVLARRNHSRGTAPRSRAA